MARPRTAADDLDEHRGHVRSRFQDHNRAGGCVFGRTGGGGGDSVVFGGAGGEYDVGHVYDCSSWGGTVCEPLE